MKKTSLIIAFLAVFAVLSAQNKDQRWSVGLHTNFTEYQGDLGNGFLSFKDINPGVSISLGYYLSPTFDITGKFGWSHVDYMDNDGTYGYNKRGYADKVGYYWKQSGEGWKFYGGLWNASANLKMKFNNGWFLKEDAAIAPFIIGGLGVTRFDQTSVRNNISEDIYMNMALYYGAGFNFRLSDRLNMVLEAGIYNPMTDVYDGIDKGTVKWEGADKSDDQFLQYSLGFTYNIGSRIDSDDDGVADKHDKCPNTPLGVAVASDGCPIDTDGDGVPDYLDKCPTEAGTINGCPDRDGDGVIDSEDKCPDVAGLRELKGCPDVDDDKDGVLNLKDKCPNTLPGVKVDANGCPMDTDGDGLADYLDKCPNEAGPAKTLGCPVQATLDKFAKQIYFNFNKSTLKTESFIVLDNVVKLLEDYGGDFTVTVKGHTDSKGSDKYNQKLSEKRAAAVKNYLIKKGISASKVNSVGYGESKPIATNDTAEGRAQNRRTEIVVE